MCRQRCWADVETRSYQFRIPDLWLSSSMSLAFRNESINVESVLVWQKKIQPTYRAMRISSLICPQTCIWRNVLERLNRNYKNDSDARSRRVPDWFVPSDEETAEKDNVDNFNDDIDISAGIHIGNDMNSSTLHHFDALSILLRLWPHDVQTPRCTDARQHSIDDLNLQCWRFISIK